MARDPFWLLLPPPDARRDAGDSDMGDRGRRKDARSAHERCRGSSKSYRVPDGIGLGTKATSTAGSRSWVQ